MSIVIDECSETKEKRMLVWATEFPGSAGKSPDDLIPLAKEWLIGSPYSEWTAAHFSDHPSGAVTHYEAGGQHVAIARVAADGQQWAGIRQVWVERGEREWTTEIVGHAAEDGLWISVRLDCNLLLPGLALPIPKKPYFLKPLFERLGGGFDGILQIGDVPVVLAEDEVDLAASLIRGLARNRLPVVYVSVGRGGQSGADARRLAKWVAGMAHVVVEPSRHFSFALSRQVGGINAYNGEIGIYWPGAVGKPEYFAPRQFRSKVELEREVEGALRLALIGVRPRYEGTWSSVQEALSRVRLEQLRSTGSTEVEKYIAEFDADLGRKQNRLDEAEAEIRRLEAVIRRYQASSTDVSDGVLKRGDEQEYYPGEMRDAVVRVLAVGRASVVPGSHWDNIIDSVLRANPPSSTPEEITADLKAALSKMSKFGSSERKALEAIGFSVEDAGKHAKATYFEDERYMFTIPKTPGDHRSGKNLVSDITRSIFGVN
ncbi:MAG TPA: hypothetical protein VF665_16880 [Longimicrobium sp.]|uniref:hypothetical protein n=1 Tax=Longimicrobium sp. TaxID=2029185 RepID=UPI002EDB8D81